MEILNPAIKESREMIKVNTLENALAPITNMERELTTSLIKTSTWEVGRMTDSPETGSIFTQTEINIKVNLARALSLAEEYTPTKVVQSIKANGSRIEKLGLE